MSVCLTSDTGRWSIPSSGRLAGRSWATSGQLSLGSTESSRSPGTVQSAGPVRNLSATEEHMHTTSINSHPSDKPRLAGYPQFIASTSSQRQSPPPSPSPPPAVFHINPN